MFLIFMINDFKSPFNFYTIIYYYLNNGCIILNYYLLFIVYYYNVLSHIYVVSP